MKDKKSEKTVTVGIIGTNFISDWFCEAAEVVENFRVAAVYSRKEETGAAFAKAHGIAKVFTDFSAFLADPEIDGVYVASPILCHKEQTVAALKAGKHVLCEKMIAAEEAEFLEMKREAERDGLVFLEAMRPMYDPALGAIREALKKVGTVRRATFSFCQYSSRYDAYLAGNVMNAFDPALKNSALADIGIYPLFLCVALFGRPTGAIRRSVFLKNGFEGEGTLLLSYPGMIASVEYSKISQGVNPSVIEGELGSLTIDKVSTPEKILWIPRGGVPEEIPLPEPPKLRVRETGKIDGNFHKVSHANMAYEIAAFRDCVLGKADPTPYLALTCDVMNTVANAKTE